MTPSAIVAGRNKWCADFENEAEEEGARTAEEDTEGEAIGLELTGLMRLKAEETVEMAWD